MRRVLRYIEALDPALRWGLFLPVGIALSYVVLAAVDWVFVLTDGYEYPVRATPGVLENSVGAFFLDTGLVLFPAVIAPNRWRAGLIMFALELLLRVGPTAYMLYSYEYMRYRAPEMWTVVAAGVVGACLGLGLVRLLLIAKPQHAIRD